MIIYKFTHKNSGRVYIGQTQGSLENRVAEHFQEAFSGSSTKFHNALRKYGRDAFDVEIIEDGINSIDLLNDREIYWIAFFDSTRSGYNSTIGGDNSPMHCPQVKQNFLKTIRSAEYRQRKSEIMKQSIANRGGFSAQHRQKLSEAMRGNHRFSGHHLTQDHINKLRSSHFKKVAGIDSSGIEHVFESVQSASLWWMSHGAPCWKDWKCCGSEQIKKSVEQNRVIYGILWKYL